MTTAHGSRASLSEVSVVIPALNEAKNLPSVFARMPTGLHEVILVDGESVDGTVDVARRLRPDIRIVHQTRTGKGNALACGVASATGEIIALIDADGSSDAAEIPQFVEALNNGAQFAKGSRFIEGGGSSDITLLRKFGNRLLTIFFNLRFHKHYSDLCYGFNLFWRRDAAVLGLDEAPSLASYETGSQWGDGFEIETLIHLRVAKAGLLVTEVPSFEHERLHGVSNLSAFPDGLRVLRTILMGTSALRGSQPDNGLGAIRHDRSRANVPEFDGRANPLPKTSSSAALRFRLAPSSNASLSELSSSSDAAGDR